MYPITPGTEYALVGMLLWENILSVLVQDDWGGPCYAPAACFDLGVAAIPDDWRFGLFSGIRASGTEVWSDPYGAAWGYPEFVDDPGHGTALAEGDAAAVAIFAARVAAADSAKTTRDGP